MSKQEDIRRIVVRDKTRYEKIKKFFEDTGADFYTRGKGTTESLFHGDQEYRFVELDQHVGKGHHLSRIVVKDVDKWLSEHAHELPAYQKDYKEQMFNVDAIEHVIGVPSVAIDINDCYWRMMRLKGYTTERTYIMGLREKRWKRGRNASIGALASPFLEWHYKKGKALPCFNQKPYVPAPEPYQHIRNHIIGDVYRMFYGLFKLLGDNFYMFLTDCVFTDYDKLKEVKRYFAHHGFRCKHKPIEFISIDREKKKVNWWDPTNKKNKNKHYLYADNQVVSGGLLQGLLGNEAKDNWLESKEMKRLGTISHKDVDK